MMEMVREGIEKGEYELPLYGDFAGMKPIESKATWNLMLTEESTTKIMVKTMTENGFDPTKDQIMNYSHIEFQPSQQYREGPRGGGILIDWNLKSTLDGLYAAGTSVFSPEDHSFAAATGRYAGRKAAAYALQAQAGAVSREQIDKEKERILAPTKREKGIDWKELHNGLCRVMQYFVSQYKTERTLNLALEEIKNRRERGSSALCHGSP
jgi:succinate dehydrogenase/fumarate reductase flavoprotein subunit